MKTKVTVIAWLARDGIGDLDQLRVAAPRHVGRLKAHLAVALLLGACHREDDVVGTARALDMLGGEVLPHEAADDLHASLSQLGELREAVVLVAEDRLDALALDPLGVVGERDVVLRRLGHARLVPDVVARQRAGLRAALLLRAGEDERLVAQRVERRARLAAHHGLAAVEPLS